MTATRLWNREPAESRDPRKTFGVALARIAADRPEIMVLSTDSSSGSGLTPFKEKYPDRHIEFGIMEQGAVGFAAGLATTGKIPFYVAIAPFVTARPYEMVRNDVGYMHQNVKIVGRCAGLTYSHLGPTHHSLDDFALMRSIPGMTILNPGDPVSIEKAVAAAVEIEGPVYMRIGSPPMPVIYHEEAPFQAGKANLLNEGRDICLIATGSMLWQALQAAAALEGEGVSAAVVDMHTVSPLDTETVDWAAETFGAIVTIEEHYVTGGLGAAVALACAAHHPVPIEVMGVPPVYAGNGPYEELLGLYGLQGAQIATGVKEFLARIS